MKLKVLRVDVWMKPPFFNVDDVEGNQQINPIIGRNGRYLLGGVAWFEYDGRAYMDDARQFEYDLSLLNAPAYRECEYKSLELLRKAGLLNREMLQKLYLYEDALLQRESHREGGLLRIKFRDKMGESRWT